MRILVIILTVLLGISHALLESGAGLQRLNKFERVYINPFKSPYFEYWYKEGISLYSWVQMNAVEFNICTLCFCLAKVTYQYSYKLYLVCLIWFVYHLLDWAMLWWDYKTSVWFYYFLNAAIICSIIALFVPEKKQAIIKSIN